MERGRGKGEKESVQKNTVSPLRGAGKGGAKGGRATLSVQTTGTADMVGASRGGGPALVAQLTLFDHAMLPVPASMPSVPQLCDFVGRQGSAGRGATGMDTRDRLTVSAWHKYAKEHFKMDTGYVQLVFDIFFDATSDGNMTDTSDIPTAEFAVYLFLLSVFKSVSLTH